MSNHVHFLVETTRKDGISRFMQQLQAYHSRWIHGTQNRDGHLWKNRFGAKEIVSAIHYRKTLLYIERNPLEARIVTRAEDYPYSSAAAHVADTPTATFGHQITVNLFLDRWRAECDPAAWRQALEDPKQAAIDSDVREILGKDRLSPLLPVALPPPKPPTSALSAR
jgi:hypothetical protein